MHKTNKHIYIYSILSIFLVCGIFGASSTGAAEASAAALEIVHKNLGVDDAYKNLRNKAITSKEAFERAIPDEGLRNMCLKISESDYLLGIYKNTLKELTNMRSRKETSIAYIKDFIKNNQSSVPQEIIKLKDDIVSELRIERETDIKGETDISEIEKRYMDFMQRINRQLGRYNDIPNELIELINKYLKIADETLKARISFYRAKNNYESNYESKDDKLKIMNDIKNEIEKNEIRKSIQLSLTETDLKSRSLSNPFIEIDIILSECLLLSNAYYNAQKELNEYQRNLNTTSRIFK